MYFQITRICQTSTMRLRLKRKYGPDFEDRWQQTFWFAQELLIKMQFSKAVSSKELRIVREIWLRKYLEGFLICISDFFVTFENVTKKSDIHIKNRSKIYLLLNIIPFLNKCVHLVSDYLGWVEVLKCKMVIKSSVSKLINISHYSRRFLSRTIDRSVSSWISFF